MDHAGPRGQKRRVDFDVVSTRQTAAPGLLQGQRDGGGAQEQCLKREFVVGRRQRHPGSLNGLGDDVDVNAGSMTGGVHRELVGSIGAAGGSGAAAAHGDHGGQDVGVHAVGERGTLQRLGDVATDQLGERDRGGLRRRRRRGVTPPERRKP